MIIRLARQRLEMGRALRSMALRSMALRSMALRSMALGSMGLGSMALAWLVAGCNPTYAPPLHTMHGSAPGRAADEYQLRVGATGAQGSAGLAIPVTRTTHVEIGSDFAESWVLGTGGFRLTGLFEEVGSMRLAGDVAVGLGVGRGGERCGNSRESMPNCDGEGTADGLAWHQRFAYGAYLDGGVALHMTDWFAPFLRVAMKFSKASNIPATIWYSALLAADFRIDAVSVYFGGGFYGYGNELDGHQDPFLEVGLAVQFGDTNAATQPVQEPPPTGG
jgi:hypothetical protein